MADEQKVMESPTLTEAKPTEAEQQKKVSEDEIKAYLEELKRAGISSPSQLKGIATNAREFGTVSNLLGQERTRTQELERRIQELEARGSRPNQGQSYDLSSYDSQQPIDLEKMIGTILERHDATKERKALERQRAAMEAYTEITGDKDYDLVRAVWEEKLKDPAFVYGINTGTVNVQRAYQETVREFYKGSLTKSREIIEQLMGKSQVKPPHVEGAQVPPSRDKAQLPVNEQLLNKIKDKAEKGGTLSTDEELAALQAVFRRT